ANLETARANLIDVRRHIRRAERISGAALELIGTASGDGVDRHAGEVAVANVRRAEQHLEFLHGFLRHDAAIRGPARLTTGSSEVEPVVLVRAVNREAVE